MTALDQILAAFHAKLDTLELDGQNLTELPPEIGMLAELQVLSLSSNQLTSLPAEIGNLSKLVELAVDENCLTELPAQIGRLTRLEILLLSHNKLRALPASIGDLVSLQALNLEHNELRTLPPEIGRLSKLRRLSIQDNRLTELPREFAQLDSLQDFDWRKRKGLPPRNVRNFIAHGNPWLYPPAEIMKQEVDSVRDYLKGENLDNPLLNGNGMNWDRWASPPPPDSQPAHKSWNPPPCPAPPPLPRITAGHMIPGAPYGCSFQSVIDVPASMDPRIDARLRRDFPEITITREDSYGPFHLTVAISTRDRSQAEKLHHEVIRRLIWTLIGWSPFPMPAFKPRTAGIDREVITNLPSLLEGPLITISNFNADILVSRNLMEALSLHREVLKGWAGDDPEDLNAIQRGEAARCILRQSVSADRSEDLQGILGLVRPAHALLAELLELGLAQVVFYGPVGRAPGGKSISLARIKVRYFGSSIAFSVPDGEAASLGEFLHLKPNP